MDERDYKAMNAEQENLTYTESAKKEERIFNSTMFKQETLEEAAREYYKRGQLGFEAAADTEKAFIKGAKWQQEQYYQETFKSE